MDMSWLEIVAALLGVANIILIVRRSVLNYPFALLMVSLYAFIFHGAKLYSDMVLQGFFLAVNVWGWLQWVRIKAEIGEVAVVLLPQRERLLWLGGIAIAALLWGAGMHFLTDAAAPWWDATIAMASVAAQILMARRALENWVLWIAVDVLAIPLFWWRGLESAAALYALFLIMSCVGLLQWKRAYKAARNS